MNTVMCAKCKKPVDKFKVKRDPVLHETVFTAYCHSKVQCVRLSDSDLATTHRVGITGAFAEK